MPNYRGTWSGTTNTNTPTTLQGLDTNDISAYTVILDESHDLVTTSSAQYMNDGTAGHTGLHQGDAGNIATTAAQAVKLYLGTNSSKVSKVSVIIETKN